MVKAARHFVGLSAALATMLASLTASAAPAPPPPPPAVAPVLIAPHIRSDTTVDYPLDGKGDAVVILALSIGIDGTVVGIAVAEGEEPFAGVASKAASKWTFDPATRDGVPIKAAIKFKVRFAAPIVETVPPPIETIEPPKVGTLKVGEVATKVAPPPESIDVVVIGDKPAPSVVTFTRAEVREIPGVFGDPFRAIETMPGVTPIVSGLPFFYVRGSPPGNIGYFLDGIRVPYLFHVGLGPSVIHPGLMERVDLYPGGYPARFGRFAGGIVSGETTEPRHVTNGEANIRLFDAGLLVETGFADGKGSVLLGGRYSYTAAIVSLIAKEVRLDYRDYQARVTYDITPKDRVTLFAFGAYDLLGQNVNGTLNVIFGSEFYRLDVRYDRKLGPNSSLRVAFTVGWDQTHVTDTRNAVDRMLGGRLELRHAITPHLVLRSGTNFVVDGFQSSAAKYSDPDSPTTQQFNGLFPPRTDLAGGFWADLVYTPSAWAEIVPGMRVDFFRSGEASATGFDPRISARFKVTDSLRIIHAYGLAHQPPSFIIPVPGLLPGSLNDGLQRSLQTSAGIEADLPWATTGTVSLFNNLFYDMTDAVGTSAADSANILKGKRSSGQAIGFELYLRRKLVKNLGGYLSYTLSRSTRTLEGNTFVATFDRTHVLSAALAYDLGRRWRAGSRLTLYTGAPSLIRPRGLITPPPTLSPDRDPSFYRLDLRLEKRWIVSGDAWVAFVIEMLNVTLHKETISGQEIGPVAIPSIGVEGAL